MELTILLTIPAQGELVGSAGTISSRDRSFILHQIHHDALAKIDEIVEAKKGRVAECPSSDPALFVTVMDYTVCPTKIRITPLENFNRKGIDPTDWERGLKTIKDSEMSKRTKKEKEVKWMMCAIVPEGAKPHKVFLVVQVSIVCKLQGGRYLTCITVCIHRGIVDAA